jgi:ABC-type antimicrobial peptide transport system permease subunit
MQKRSGRACPRLEHQTVAFHSDRRRSPRQLARNCEIATLLRTRQRPDWAIALALALVGVGAIVAYIVSQRTREFAIRMAVGATRPAIMNSLMRHILKFSSFGVALGLLLALNVNRIPRYLIYGIRTIDLLSFIAAPAVLTVAIFLASYIPILAVLKIDPAALLRGE